MEVLEEDLKTSTAADHSSTSPPSPSSPEPNQCLKEFFPQTYISEFSRKTEMAMTPEPFSPPVPSPELCFSFPGAEYRQSIALISDSFGGYGSDGFEDMRRSPPQYVADSPSPPDYHMYSYHDSLLPSPEPAYDLGREHGEGSGESPVFQRQGYQRGEWGDEFYFWNQLEREENQLKRISNRELLAPDESGKV